MREHYLSNCEKSFIQKSISEGYRLDGRNYKESRKLQVSYGSEYGSCMVSLGETRVLAQVSCEVVTPKQIRPNEGILFINIEISPMAAPNFEANRQTDYSVYLNRLLEKCYKDSKCLDLESLCIVVEENVWSLRVDIKILNHAGNIVECASIATLASLAHFRRPDVTRSGESVIIHTISEKDPIPTVLYHYPVCLSFAILSDEVLLSDPSFMEESVATCNTEDGINERGGLLVIAMNQYKELCLIDMVGAAIFNTNLIKQASHIATEKAKEIVDMIKKKISEDDLLRQKRTKVNFSQCITENHALSLSKKELSIKLKNFNTEDIEMDIAEEDDNNEPWKTVETKESNSKYQVVSKKKDCAETVKKEGKSTWLDVSSDSDE